MTPFPIVHDPPTDHLLTPPTTSWVQLVCELQRDWIRSKILPGFSDIRFAVEGH